MEQIREETNTKIAALLDDTQKTTFAAWVAKHKRHQAQESQDGPPPPPPDGGGPSDGGGGPPPSE
jgi:hypothetical protein